MTKDEALRLALEALELHGKQYPHMVKGYCIDAITAIKAELLSRSDGEAQTRSVVKDEPVAWKWHQAPVKTSWGDEMVVADLSIDKDHTVSIYCERHQTAKVEAMFTPPQQEAKNEPDAYGYAKRLAEAIWSKHYKTIAPQWVPFDELIGVLTQIDNMTSGLISPQQKEAKDEPVATKNNDGVTLHLGWDDLPVGTKLYATPPQRTWIGLTDDEQQQAYEQWQNEGWGVFYRAIEAKLKELNT